MYGRQRNDSKRGKKQTEFLMSNFIKILPTKFQEKSIKNVHLANHDRDDQQKNPTLK